MIEHLKDYASRGFFVDCPACQKCEQCAGIRSYCRDHTFVNAWVDHLNTGFDCRSCDTPCRYLNLEDVCLSCQSKLDVEIDPANTIPRGIVTLEEMERFMIGKALKKHSGHRENAAKELGISERTIYRKIRQYSL